jgi:hypothetical protein
MSAKVLIHARHTAKEVSEAVSRAWPDVLFMLYRERGNGLEESLLGPDESLRASSSNTLALEGAMTGREVNNAFREAFGVLVEISVESGKSCMHVPLDKAR